jgi:hypothetical protein
MTGRIAEYSPREELHRNNWLCGAELELRWMYVKLPSLRTFSVLWWKVDLSKIKFVSI